MSAGRRRRLRRVVAAAAAGVAGRALVWVAAGRGPGVSLLGGPFPRGVEIAAAGCWAAALGRGDRRWWRVTLPVLVGVTVAVVGLTAGLLHWTGTVNDHYPPSFALWVGSVILAGLACPVRLRQRRDAARTTAVAAAVAVLAVPLSGAAAFLLINDHYGYWPALGDLVGHRLDGQISSAQLAAALGTAAGSPPSQPARGRLAPLDIPATSSGFAHMTGSVYLPPAFFAGRHHLPVVVMLAGVPNSPAAWPHAGFATATADGFAATHRGLAPILVFVDENGSITADSECVDGPRGRAETYLTVDVPRFVIRTFGASADPDDWAILGFSEGGTCALDLALRHPDVYRRFVDLAGDPAPTLGDPARTLAGLYGGDRAAMAGHDPAALLARQPYRHTEAWFVVGTDDASHRRTGDDLTGAARAAGITVHTDVIDGGHNWQFASRALRAVLAPLAGSLGIGGPAGTIAVPQGDGYWLATADGQVLPFGDARSFGTPQGRLAGRSVVGMAGTPDGDGYWVLASDGTLFAFGDAPDIGSAAGVAGAVAVAATPGGRGVWVATADGRVLALGDAVLHGSLAGRALNRPIVGLAATPTGGGYWLVAADGGVFAFGDAVFAGSLAAAPPASPVVGLAAMPTGQGYWLATAAGQLRPLMVRGDDKPFPGKADGSRMGGAVRAGGGGSPGWRPGPGAGPAVMNRPVVGVGAMATDFGGWLVGADGGVFAFGQSPFFGSAASAPLSAPVVAIAPLLEE